MFLARNLSVPSWCSSAVRQRPSYSSSVPFQQQQLSNKIQAPYKHHRTVKYAFNIKQIRKYRYLKIKYEIYLQFYRILIMIFRTWNYLQFILYASPIFKIKIKHKISDKYFSPTSGKSKRKSHRQICLIAKATRSCPSGSTNVAFLLLTSELGPILAVYL